MQDMMMLVTHVVFGAFVIAGLFVWLRHQNKSNTYATLDGEKKRYDEGVCVQDKRELGNLIGLPALA